MKRRELLASLATLSSIGALGLLPGCASQVLRGTGDLGVVIGRANGTLYLVDTTAQSLIGEVPGLGDLSHASVVFSRDGLFAYVFGRDGGLTQVNLLERRITRRIMQAGNSIGGAISADGTLVAAQNYTPGGVKVFDARTLEMLADIPAEYGPGKLSRVVGLFENIGRQPYDALVTPNGRHYIAGLFGEDGLAQLDLWAEDCPQVRAAPSPPPEGGKETWGGPAFPCQPKVRRILGGYGKGQEPLPVYKMPHLRGWAVAGRRAYLPAIGRHEVLVVDTETWAEVGRIPVAGQPVFVMARPDGRQVWVNFAVPDYHRVQVIDTQSQQIVQTLAPGKAVLHMEFTPRGEAVWISSRDDNRVSIVDTQTFATRARLDVPAPSGIFFTARAARVGF